MNADQTLLFMPAPEHSALQDVGRSAWQSFKSNGVRYQELIFSAVSGRINFTDYHHVRRRNTNRGDIAIGVAIQKQVAQHRPAASIESVGWDDVSRSQLAQILKRFSRLIICGGGYIFLNSRGELNSRALDLEVFEDFSGRLIAHGIGLNRLLHEQPLENFDEVPPATREWAKRFSDCCEYISVRDQGTADFFSAVAGRDVPVVGDPALSLGDFSASSATKKTDGVVSHHVIGINTASHGRRALKCLAVVMPHFERLFREMSESGAQLRYFVHDDADYSVIKYLRLRGHRFQVIDGSVSTLIHAYRHCDFVVNQMLHSSILAYAVDVPVVAVAYDLKSAGFFDLFGLGDYCLRWDELDWPTLKSRIADLRVQRESLTHRISQRRGSLCHAQNEFLARAMST